MVEELWVEARSEREAAMTAHMAYNRAQITRIEPLSLVEGEEVKSTTFGITKNEAKELQHYINNLISASRGAPVSIDRGPTVTELLRRLSQWESVNEKKAGE
jgi:hypothetical protein